MTLILFLISFIFGGVAEAAVQIEENPLDQNEFVMGAGVYLGFEQRILSNINTFEYGYSSIQDYIYIEPEIFYNFYFSDSIKETYGLGLNLGYEIEDWFFYFGGGYLLSKIDYKYEEFKKKKTESAPYISVGMKFAWTDKIRTKVNCIVYSIDFKDEENGNSGDLTVVALSLGVGLSF